jgi:hypothetical protein
MPTLLTPPPLETLLKGLHDSEIRCGIQNEPPAGGITAWIDFGSRTEKATFYGTIVGDQQVWPAADRIAASRVMMMNDGKERVTGWPRLTLAQSARDVWKLGPSAISEYRCALKPKVPRETLAQLPVS